MEASFTSKNFNMVLQKCTLLCAELRRNDEKYYGAQLVNKLKRNKPIEQTKEDVMIDNSRGYAPRRLSLFFRPILGTTIIKHL